MGIVAFSQGHFLGQLLYRGFGGPQTRTEGRIYVKIILPESRIKQSCQLSVP